MAQAFGIRKGLLIRSYRDQALWVGGTAIYWVIAVTPFYLLQTIIGFYPFMISALTVPLAILLISILYLGVFLTQAWVSSIVRVAKDTDPKDRDTLRWNKARWLFWGAFFIGTGYGGFFLVPPLLSNVGLGAVRLGLLLYGRNAPIFFLMGVIDLIILYVSFHNSADAILKRHLRWLAIYVVVLLFNAAFVISISGRISSFEITALGELATSATASLLWAFCLYKCARSLVATSPFPVETSMKK